MKRFQTVGRWEWVSMHVQELLFVAAILVPQCLRALRYSQGTGDENCETLKSEIHLIKEEFDELGRMQRTCNADVIVNKCEGLCNSQVQPSVITPTGFLKVSLNPASIELANSKVPCFPGVLLLPRKLPQGKGHHSNPLL